jgi:hypothetical protein
MTRSPPAVARDAQPAYSSKGARKDFTQHQLFAGLSLETFLKTDYRGAVQVLADAAFDSEQSHRYCRAGLGESPRRLIPRPASTRGPGSTVNPAPRGAASRTGRASR